jgi:hypothetical protein
MLPPFERSHEPDAISKREASLLKPCCDGNYISLDLTKTPGGAGEGTEQKLQHRRKQGSTLS